MGWLESPDTLHERDEPPKVGVALQRTDGSYTYEPTRINDSLAFAIRRLEVNVAISISSDISSAIFRKISENQTFITSPSSTLRIPILDSLDDVGYNKEIESTSPVAYMLRREEIILVTAPSAEIILHNGRAVEAMILELVSPPS